MCEVLDRAENKGKENARLEAIKKYYGESPDDGHGSHGALKLPEEDWPMYESRL